MVTECACPDNVLPGEVTVIKNLDYTKSADQQIKRIIQINSEQHNPGNHGNYGGCCYDRSQEDGCYGYKVDLDTADDDVMGKTRCDLYLPHRSFHNDAGDLDDLENHDDLGDLDDLEDSCDLRDPDNFGVRAAPPIIVFVHGGGWRRGHKQGYDHYLSRLDTNFLLYVIHRWYGSYGNVGRGLAARGIPCAVLTYPLSRVRVPWCLLEQLTSLFCTIIAIGPPVLLTGHLLSVLLGLEAFTDMTLRHGILATIGISQLVTWATMILRMRFYNITASFVLKQVLVYVILTSLMTSLLGTCCDVLCIQSACLLVVVQGSLSLIYSAIPNQTEAVTYQAEAVTHQSEAMTHQSEAVTHQTESVTHQTEAVKHQTEAVTHQTEAATHQTEAVTHQTEAIARCIGFLQTLGARTGSFHPQRLYLAGHSAGAHLVTMVTLDSVRRRNSVRGIRGIVGVSGVYDIPRLGRRIIASNLYVNPTFGADKSRWEDWSPVHVIQSSISSISGCPPILLINAQGDLGLEKDAERMDELLADQKIHFRRIILQGVNHFSIIVYLTSRLSGIFYLNHSQKSLIHTTLQDEIYNFITQNMSTKQESYKALFVC